jgi:hypothetical protein
MKKFYYGIGFGNELKLPAKHILISASGCWGKGGMLKFVVPKITSNPESIWIDSGGFTCFTKWKDYPWTVEQYVAFVREFCEKYPQVEYVTVMDLPCEPNTNRDEGMTNEMRIRKTVTNTRMCLNYKIPAQWVAVIQGYTKKEYTYCGELMAMYDLFTPLTAIGSICQRKGTKELKDMILYITDLNKDVKWHTFGMQISVLKDKEIADRIYSSDSGAWKFLSGYTGGNWKPSKYEDKLVNFIRYSRNIEEQILGDYRIRNLVEGV